MKKEKTLSAFLTSPHRTLSKNLSRGTLREGSKTFIMDFMFSFLKELKQKKSFKKINLAPLFVESGINGVSSMSGKMALNLSQIYLSKYKLIGLVVYTGGYLYSKNLLNQTKENIRFEYQEQSLDQLYYLDCND